MFAFGAGQKPAEDFAAFATRAATAAIMAVLLAATGGCATHQTQTAGYANGAQVAEAVVDVEDDGLPAQTPPPIGIRERPDDPSEPYSRNYGGANPSASAAPIGHEVEPRRAPPPDVPDDLPPAFRQKLVAALSQDDE